jgi:hypothetical protein
MKKITFVFVTLALAMGLVSSTTIESNADGACVKTEYWNSCGEFYGWSGTDYNCPFVEIVIIDVECDQ